MPNKQIDRKVLLAAYKREQKRLWFKTFYKEKQKVNQAKYEAKFDNYNRESHLRKHYGITQEQYLALVGQQQGLCAICHEKPLKSLDIDHNHETKRVRGLLCGNCNRGLGLFKDSVLRFESAIHYLTPEDN